MHRVHCLHIQGLVHRGKGQDSGPSPLHRNSARFWPPGGALVIELLPLPPGEPWNSYHVGGI